LELNDDPNYVRRFNSIEKGISGLIEVVEKVFYGNYKEDKKILDEVIKQSGGKALTIPNTDYGPTTNIYEKHLKKILANKEIGEWFEQLKDLSLEPKKEC